VSNLRFRSLTRRSTTRLIIPSRIPTINQRALAPSRLTSVLEQPCTGLARRTAGILLVGVSVVSISGTPIDAQGECTVIRTCGAEAEAVPNDATVAGDINASG